MESQEQAERLTCRLIVLGADGTEILVKNTGAGFILPSVEIPRWERVAENLTAALKRDWGCDAVCLLTPRGPDEEHSNGGHYEVVECWRNLGIRLPTEWRTIRSLGPNSFLRQADLTALQLCMHQLEKYERDPSSPFAQRGWIGKLRDWTSQVIRPLGLELTGSVQQFNGSPAFNLIRFETTGPAVWFKAVGEPNLREFPITLQLAELFPAFVPEILGTRAECNGWLSREVDGSSLGETRNIGYWERAATELAKLQIESITTCESLVPLGARDLRIDALLSAINPFFDLIEDLMDEQPKTPPAILSREELSRIRVLVDDALTTLADLKVPATLGHLDLNPWNIIVSADRCVFLDWVEAYAGHPFFSFEYLLQHFRRNRDDDAAFESRLVDAYTNPWRPTLSDGRLSNALALTPLAALFAFAAGTDTWKAEERLLDPNTAGYLRSLARSMNREAIQMERRASCQG